MFKFNPEAKRYFKFFSALLALLVFLGTFVIAANWIVGDRMFPFDDQVRRAHTDFLEGRIEGLRDTKVLVLGDSTAARALIPPSLTNEKTFSLMINGGGAAEAYYVLKRVYDLGSRPSCIVFMTSYGAYRYHLRQKLWQTTITQYLIPPRDIVDYFETTSEMGLSPGADVFLPWAKFRILSAPILRHLDWSTLHRAVFKPYEVFTHPRRAYRLTRMGRGSNPLQAGTIWNGPEFDGPLQEYLKGPFQENKVPDFYLRRLLDLAEKEKSTVLMLMSPVATTLRTPTSLAWIANAENHVDAILKPKSNVINRFRTQWMDPTDFSDGTHLVDTAGREYSESLRSLVNECVSRTNAP